MNYVYDVITGDIEARREKGEILAKMKVNNSNVSPKDYGVKENEEMFKNQLSKAKVEKDIAEIKERKARIDYLTTKVNVEAEEETDDFGEEVIIDITEDVPDEEKAEAEEKKDGAESE